MRFAHDASGVPRCTEEGAAAALNMDIRTAGGDVGEIWEIIPSSPMLRGLAICLVGLAWAAAAAYAARAISRPNPPTLVSFRSSCVRATCKA